MSNDRTESDDHAITPAWPIPDDEIRKVFETIFADGSWGRYHGPHCDALRMALAEFHGVEHVILCSSGTAAVELALRSVPVQSGDEVILAAYDYKANFANVLSIGAIPVLVDTLPGLPVLDPSQLPSAITDKTKAIVCSHLHGCFAEIDAIKVMAAQHDVRVIEDACQSPGAVINGRTVGSIGDAGVLSFGGSKLLTSGRGGAVLTNDASIAQRIRLYTQRGNDAYPLSEMQAAVLLPQLHQLSDRNQTRHRNVCRIMDQLPTDGPLQPALNLSLHRDDFPAYYKVAFRYLPQPNGPPREEFSGIMRQQGIALDPGFPALHLIHAQRRFRAIGDLPNATAINNELMTLHHPVLLQSAEEIELMISVLQKSGD